MYGHTDKRHLVIMCVGMADWAGLRCSVSGVDSGARVAYVPVTHRVRGRIVALSLSTGCYRNSECGLLYRVLMDRDRYFLFNAVPQFGKLRRL